MKYKSPLCPYCFDGYIVHDGFGNFFCSACLKNVGIKKFNFEYRLRDI